MRCDKRALYAALVSGMILFAASTRAGDVRYHVRSLGVMPGGEFDSLPTAINDSAQVAGSGDVEFTIHAYRWDPVAGMIDLGSLPGRDGSWGEAINSAGHVAGASQSSDGMQGFLWTPEAGMIGLGDLPGGSVFSYAMGINDLDQVIGTSRSDSGGGGSSDTEAFIWDAEKGMIGLGDLPGGQFFSVANDVNNAGQVCGSSVTERAGIGEVFIWDAENGMRAIGDLPGGGFGICAAAINERGQIVGTAGSRQGTQAFLWDPVDGMMGLGFPPGGWAATVAYDINEREQVVGMARRDVRTVEACIWDREHGMRKLTPLLDVRTTVKFDRLKFAAGINNAGQIAALPNNSGIGVLLTPFTLGDLNCDGSLDLTDVAPFVEALIDIERYKRENPDCPLGEFAADTNQDGSVDLQDVQTFIELLLQ